MGSSSWLANDLKSHGAERRSFEEGAKVLGLNLHGFLNWCPVIAPSFGRVQRAGFDHSQGALIGCMPIMRLVKHTSGWVDMQRRAIASLYFFVSVFVILAGHGRPAKAVPRVPAERAAKSDDALIQKVHGWHYRCAWGPFRFHRHVEGVGNVRCRIRREQFRPYRRRPSARYCESRFYVCKDEWGGRTRGFYRCMRRYGCE